MNGPVCDDNWDIDDGHVVCRELGFSSALEITRGSYFGSAFGDFTTNNVACSGSEEALEFCQRQDKANTFCHSNEAAGVVCKVIKEKSIHHRMRRDPSSLSNNRILI